MDMSLLWIGLIQLGSLALILGLLLKRRRDREWIHPAESAPGEDREALERLNALRSRSLTPPLTELARPGAMGEVLGQAEGIRALRAALLGPNPQHVLLYGPPGVGKTCAARLILEEAKNSPGSPFPADAPFVEMDATCIRFDERAIADPLMGSVHDPIYQGAGPLGRQGIPQPRAGAVTKAHCGILFLDEIGELHPQQMQKLLKVLEDRQVHFESAYYDRTDPAVPAHIKSIFDGGLPADFRLIGATTRRPEELPPALRSRCVELHFAPLSPPCLTRIAGAAASRAGLLLEEGVANLAASYACSGREAVNLVQLAAGLARSEGRRQVACADVHWAARAGCCAKRPEGRISTLPRVGVLSLLAVGQGGMGVVLELECTLRPSQNPGIVLNGGVESEELTLENRSLRRRGSALGSGENAVCALSALLGVDLSGYAVRFNIVGGLPADGPSAGLAMALALYSALTEQPLRPGLAATGEITMYGEVRPVGGLREKVDAAVRAGGRLVLLPREEGVERIPGGPVLCPVSTLAEACRAGILQERPSSSTILPKVSDCVFCESHLY